MGRRGQGVGSPQKASWGLDALRAPIGTNVRACSRGVTGASAGPPAASPRSLALCAVPASRNHFVPCLSLKRVSSKYLSSAGDVFCTWDRPPTKTAKILTLVNRLNLSCLLIIYVKLDSFRTAERTISKRKRQPADWEGEDLHQ